MKGLEDLRRKQEKQVQAAILEGEEKNQEVLRKNEEKVDESKREYQEKERKILEENEANVLKKRKKNEVSLALLLSKNEAEVSKMTHCVVNMETCEIASFPRAVTFEFPVGKNNPISCRPTLNVCTAIFSSPFHTCVDF